MEWYEKLPAVDGDSWNPKPANKQALRDALLVSCQIAQARIVSRADAEIRFNQQNYDSGLSVEDIVRDEISALLPSRYTVSPGVISDQNGASAQESDLVVRDGAWSPVIKPRATSESRRIHLPIECVYAITEIKQTLGFTDLDRAMAQLVAPSRLRRAANPYGHITENQHILSLDSPGKLLNPLHTTVFATRLQDGVNFTELARRFGAINARLNRDQMVNMLCVLGAGTAWYSVASGNPFNATYMTDREQSLILQINHREPKNAFYRHFVELLGHLTRSVLGLTEVSTAYGQPPPERDIEEYPDAAFNKGLVPQG